MNSLIPRSKNCFYSTLNIKCIKNYMKYLLSAKTFCTNDSWMNIRVIAENKLLECECKLKNIAILNKDAGKCLLSYNSVQLHMVNRLNRKYIHTSSFYCKPEINSDLNPRERSRGKTIINSFKDKAGPYFKLMRYDKLTGTYLLYIPCTWSILLAYDPNITSVYETTKTLILFLIGAYIMRSAGCIINDILDKDIDAKVIRTKDRPLASERLTNSQALVLLAGHLSAGLGVLLQLNWLSVFIGAPSVILVALYPLAKRYTHMAQLVLGSVFSWGAILGNTAITGSLIPGTVLPLYLATLCWIVYYDTIYAHQDRPEDVQLGLKSTAILLSGSSPTSTPEGRMRLRMTLGCLSGATLTGCGLSILHATQGTISPAMVMLLLAPAATHFTWQISSLNEDNPGDCATKFQSNVHVGAIILGVIITAKILQGYKSQLDEPTSPGEILAIAN